MPSKSAKKREVLGLQSLGERLLGLTEEQLQSMHLDERLSDAVSAATRMKSRGALRRQRQLIGKLMRNVDPEPIRIALDRLQRQEREDKEVFRRAEYWRDRIVQQGLDGLEEYFEMTGSVDDDLSSLLQHLLQSHGDAARKTFQRKIFRKIHAQLSVQNSTR